MDAVEGIPVLGGLAELPLIVAEQQPDLVVLAVSRNLRLGLLAALAHALAAAPAFGLSFAAALLHRSA